MKQVAPYVLFLLVALSLNSCKKEEDDVYPPVVTEILCARTDDTGSVSYLDTDGGKTYRALNGSLLTGLARDSVYRIYCVYDLSVDAQDGATLYSFQPLLSPGPVKANRFPGGVKTDPLTVVSVWQSGDYINLSLEIFSQDTRKHRFHFVDGGIGTNVLYRELNLTLYHDQGGDLEAYFQNVYLSVPLRNYSEVLTPGDLILFHINTYDGLRVYQLAYYP